MYNLSPEYQRKYEALQERGFSISEEYTQNYREGLLYDMLDERGLPVATGWDNIPMMIDLTYDWVFHRKQK